MSQNAKKPRMDLQNGHPWQPHSDTWRRSCSKTRRVVVREKRPETSGLTRRASVGCRKWEASTSSPVLRTPFLNLIPFATPPLDVRSQVSICEFAGHVRTESKFDESGTPVSPRSFQSSIEIGSCRGGVGKTRAQRVSEVARMQVVHVVAKNLALSSPPWGICPESIGKVREICVGRMDLFVAKGARSGGGGGQESPPHTPPNGHCGAQSGKSGRSLSFG